MTIFFEKSQLMSGDQLLRSLRSSVVDVVVELENAPTRGGDGRIRGFD